MSLYVRATLGKEWRGGQLYQGTGYLQITHHPLAVCSTACFPSHFSFRGKENGGLKQKRPAAVTDYRIGSGDSTDAYSKLVWFGLSSFC